EISMAEISQIRTGFPSDFDAGDCCVFLEGTDWRAGQFIALGVLADFCWCGFAHQLQSALQARAEAVSRWCHRRSSDCGIHAWTGIRRAAHFWLVTREVAKRLFGPRKARLTSVLGGCPNNRRRRMMKLPAQGGSHVRSRACGSASFDLVRLAGSRWKRQEANSSYLRSERPNRSGAY